MALLTLSASASASASASLAATVASAAMPAETTPAQGALDSAGAGITGGYTGDSLSLKIIIAFFIGLSLYNSVELIVLCFVTFQHYHGLYFWSLVISSFGIIPYALGFLLKFFRVLDPHQDEGYVGVVLLTIGWYSMVTGQSVVLWSRLHLVTNSRQVLRWTLYMIIGDGVILHSITTVLTFGSNSNTLSRPTLERFVRGYSIMEKIQMVGFFLQETILSVIYIKETIRLLKLSEAVQDDTRSFDDTTTVANGHLKQASVRKTMYQLIAVNVLIIMMDLALLSVEFANLYLIETTLKGVVYSIKLKLEFAVLGKLIQLVRDRAESDPSLSANGFPVSSPGATTAAHSNSISVHNYQHANGHGSAMLERRNRLSLEKWSSRKSQQTAMHDFGKQGHAGNSSNVMAAGGLRGASNTTSHDGTACWETRGPVEEQERWKRRRRNSSQQQHQARRGSWIDLEMDNPK
ncbi:hypothetical protein ACJQWK_09892 [Exserohilum turcicum]